MLTVGLLLSIIPFIWALVIKYVFKRKIHLLEMLGVFGAGVLIVTAGLVISYGSSVRDTQILNGKVTSKEHHHVSCEHSYPCNCRTDSKGSTTCDTCYDHAYDVSWYVHSTVGSTEIDRINSQGTKEPPRWTQAEVGEPYSKEEGYTNYILGVGNSLFAGALLDEKTRSEMPVYTQVYDYYRYQHTIALGAQVPDIKAWNDQLGMVLESLGGAKQVNINVIFVGGKTRDFGPQLEAAWFGGKKNDINIVIGVTNYPKVDWVYAFTFAHSAGNALTTIQLRDRLQEPGAIDTPGKGAITIESVVSNTFHRKPMEDFAYLADEVVPSVAAIVAIIVLMIVACAGLTVYFVNNDLDSEGTIL